MSIIEPSYVVTERAFSPLSHRKARDETRSVKVETCTTLMLLVHPYNEETEERKPSSSDVIIEVVCTLVVSNGTIVNTLGEIVIPSAATCNYFVNNCFLPNDPYVRLLIYTTRIDTLQLR